MAKTKRSISKKQEQISEDLKTRVLAIFGLFLIVVSSLRLGFVGDKANFLVTYSFGNFTGILYLVMFIFCLYVTITAKLPNFTGLKPFGVYLLSISLLIFIAMPNDDTLTGMAAVNQYLDSGALSKGGLFGSILYGVLSSMFDYLGTLVAAILVFNFGLFLIIGKSYFVYMNNTKPKKEAAKNAAKKRITIDDETYILEKHKKNIVGNFFTNPSAKEGAFFGEDVFDENGYKIDKNQDFIRKRPVDTIVRKKPVDIHEEPVRVHQMTMFDTIDVDNQVDEVISNKEYQLPLISMLSTPRKEKGDNSGYATANAKRLTDVLREFGVIATVRDVFIGPSVTKYELTLESGVRVNKILQLQDDIKLALAAKDIRIEAPIPGKSAVGIEIPNLISSAVSMKEVLIEKTNNLKSNKLVVPLGRDVSGKAIFAELDKMPHLLIAGATGSGKSVCINTIISSILMQATPDEVRMILIDPKKVELSNYNGIPHLLAPVVTDAKKAAAVLREVVSEMESRYELFAQSNVRNISSYNEYVLKKSTEENPLKPLAYHVVILDEVADLMMVASKDVEDCIMRIAQMARAAGIHMIVATQRPSTDVITGVIKANIPSRIAFAVSSGIDSRTILDTSGAEKLLGKGDMLFSPMGSSAPTRVQGAFLSDEEVSSIVHFVSKQQSAVFEDRFVNAKESSSSNSADSLDDNQEDSEYQECRTFVINAQKASASLLQRQFRIGYNKAARIIDQLESEGIIGPQIGSKPREVYVRGYQEEDL